MGALEAVKLKLRLYEGIWKLFMGVWRLKKVVLRLNERYEDY